MPKSHLDICKQNNLDAPRRLRSSWLKGNLEKEISEISLMDM
jgi:hypothetical protein